MSRYYIPVNPDYRVAGKLGCVAFWEWTKHKGLICHTQDGFQWRSEWGSLRAFLIAVRERRETAVKLCAIPPAAFGDAI